MNVSDLEEALREINGHLITKKEIQYVFHVSSSTFLSAFPFRTCTSKNSYLVSYFSHEKVRKQFSDTDTRCRHVGLTLTLTDTRCRHV